MCQGAIGLACSGCQPPPLLYCLDVLTQRRKDAKQLRIRQRFVVIDKGFDREVNARLDFLVDPEPDIPVDQGRAHDTRRHIVEA